MKKTLLAAVLAALSISAFAESRPLPEGYIPLEIGGMMRDDIARSQQLSEIQRAKDARAAVEEYKRIREQETTFLDRAKGAFLCVFFSECSS